MITGPFLDLTLLCVGILVLGAISFIGLSAAGLYPVLKRRRATAPKNKKPE